MAPAWGGVLCSAKTARITAVVTTVPAHCPRLADPGHVLSLIQGSRGCPALLDPPMPHQSMLLILGTFPRRILSTQAQLGHSQVLSPINGLSHLSCLLLFVWEHVPVQERPSSLCFLGGCCAPCNGLGSLWLLILTPFLAGCVSDPVLTSCFLGV